MESMLLRLDSSHPNPGQWPFAPSAPRLLLRCDGHSRITSLHNANDLVQTWDDPCEALDWMEQHATNLPATSHARWIGYLSYDLGRLFENLPATAADDLNSPLFEFGFCDRPHEMQRISPSTGTPGEGREGVLSNDSPSQDYSSEPIARPQSNFTRETYCDAVQRVIDYIAAGDVFQVNLSQRFTVECSDAPAAIYDRLTAQTPAWYGALLDFGHHALVCNSPELFLKVDTNHRIITRPIKGTRPLGPGMEALLRDSNKDQAELNMIVDLERNDLGRVCEIGSVKVSEPRTIEAHPTVYHGAATIEGKLREDVSFSDLLRATFPGGSVTGAPKIRAMQIIEELEPIRRGPYCGAIGYIAPGGQIEFNVAIRTMILKNARAYISVGGGIVADSQADAEYEETLVKARAMFSALGAAR